MHDARDFGRASKLLVLQMIMSLTNAVRTCGAEIR